MTKSELIQFLAQRYPDLYLRDIERSVEVIIEEITAAMSRGDRVELRGFGSFSAKKRAARTARNPRNGTVVSVEAKFHAHFKTGRELHKRLNSELPE